MHAYPMLFRATQRYAPREILRKTAKTKVYPLHILHSEVYFSSILLVFVLHIMVCGTFKYNNGKKGNAMCQGENQGISRPKSSQDCVPW